MYDNFFLLFKINFESFTENINKYTYEISFIKNLFNINFQFCFVFVKEFLSPKTLVKIAFIIFLEKIKIIPKTKE
jgi:hypothetical protein